MSTPGAPARWIQVVLAVAIATLAVLGGLGVVTIREEDAHGTPATEAEAKPATAPAGEMPAPAVTGGTSSTISGMEALGFGADRRPVDKREVIVFMQPVATASQIGAVRRSLAGMADVSSVRFVDQAAAYEEMKALFADHPELVAKIKPEDAPANFHVLPRPNVDRHVIGARLAGLPGVLNIAYPGE